MTRRSPALALAKRLCEQSIKLVLVESCTAGEAASQLGRVPGISDWWCGSLVAYRPLSKQGWLEIPGEMIERYSAESPEVTLALVRQALVRTPEANLAGAITGHLGPKAPPDRDGLVHIATLLRDGEPHTCQIRLRSATRRRRQMEAAERLLEALAAELESFRGLGG